MCAAPGSKTAQLLEGVVGDGQDFPDGLVIANDSDQNRAYMLVRQAKRLQTPLLIVTNHDAQSFPKILHQQVFIFNSRVTWCKQFNLIEFYVMFHAAETVQ